MFGKWVPKLSENLTILAGVTISDWMKNKANPNITVCAQLNDDIETRTEKFEADWNGFWHFFNVMQFSPNFAAVSVNGMYHSVYDSIHLTMMKETAVAVEEENVIDESWDEVVEQLFDDTVKECVDKLIRLGVSAPSIVGYELQDNNGAIVAECELAWENEKIALLMSEQLEWKNKFEDLGWKVFSTVDDFSSEMFQGGSAK